jgi:hypothetical protein
VALRVAFSDFWARIDPERELLLRRLRTHADVEVVAPREAELLFFSDFGLRHSTFVGTKVHYTPENARPAWATADFAIGFDHIDDPRYLRFPVYVRFLMNEHTDVDRRPPGIDWSAREFCLFLYSRTVGPERAALLDAIASYRPVVSPGALRNNTTVPELAPRGDPRWHLTKLEYQRRFRFTIACENGRHPGYTTEKLVDALLARTIPIYWGNPRADEDVRASAFIHADDFADFRELTAYVREVDRDPALAAAYLAVDDWLVRPLADWQAALDELLGRVVAAVGSTPRRALRARAARACALAAETKARRVPGRLRRTFGAIGR